MGGSPRDPYEVSVQLSDLQSIILARLSIDTTETSSITQINYYLNSEYQQICQTYQLYENVITTLTPTPGNPVITLPTSPKLVEIESIVFDTNVLEPVTFERLAELIAITNSGAMFWGSPKLPQYYNFLSIGQIYVQPTPDATTPPATMFYSALPTPLVNPTDVPSQIPDAYHEWICERALIAMSLNEQDVYGADLGNQLQVQRMQTDFVRWRRRVVGKIPARISLSVYNENP